ncbi:MAG: lysine--tRNA ligase, partial [Lentisphaeria bacterium]|nr:lysine--tRNA ligase [Lentisphaeria bacterium]
MIGDVRELFAKPGEDDPEAAGPEVNVAGRLVAKRGMGKSIFADVRDSSGRIQLFAG